MPEQKTNFNLVVFGVIFVIFFSGLMVLFNFWVKQSLKEESWQSDVATTSQPVVSTPEKVGVELPKETQPKLQKEQEVTVPHRVTGEFFPM